MASDQPPSKPNEPANPRGRTLARTIFQSEHPEQFIKSIPVQSVYLAVREQGLESSADLIEIASLEQCRLMLDFDTWIKDRFDEDRFWTWLALTDATDSLTLLQKLFKVFDLKLIALLVARYVDVQTLEHQSDTPPAPEFHTPDKGTTWLSIKLEDPERHFLLGRLLALIFETNADLFYQLLAIPARSTPSELEEESYQERTRRLNSEGIPDATYAAELHAPMTLAALGALLKNERPAIRVHDIPVVHPLVHAGAFPEPLGSWLKQRTLDEELQAELTLLMNAALVYFSTDFSDLNAVKLLAEKVRGAINIGIESACEVSGHSVDEAVTLAGIQALYRHGLTRASVLRGEAQTLLREEASGTIESHQLLVAQGLAAPFPEIPAWVDDSGSIALPEESLKPDFRAIEHLREIEAARKLMLKQ